MFPHRNRKFAEYFGKREGFWITNKYEEARSIVICESAIDCISHAALHPGCKYAYISMAGAPSGEQKTLLQKILEWATTRAGKEVIICMDNDEQGDKYYGSFSTFAPSGLKLIRILADKAKDWNDQLRGIRDSTYF